MHASSVLLLGIDLPQRSEAAEVLLSGQRRSGAWSAEAADESASLGGTYRVVRVLRALSRMPNLAAANRFLGSCRRRDGSYAESPASSGGDLVNIYLALNCSIAPLAPHCEAGPES